jgi:hypothetical protein|uniref:Uncharacterized protein n=1 Tax=viral metagenome TaxID=1070528 RepID=A0A6C0IPJ3_9ZZZZ
MSYRPYIELVKAFIPTIVMVGLTSYTWKMCDLYEKKYGYKRPIFKILSGFPLYLLFLSIHFYELTRSEKSLKRLKHMRLSRKC